MELFSDFNAYLLLMTRLFGCGAAAQRRAGPPHSWDSYITHNDASLSAELLWTSDQLIAQASIWQHTTHTQQTIAHAPGGIRSHILSRRASLDLAATGIGND